jgi:dolichol-phosphate mannosyltransferase
MQGAALPFELVLVDDGSGDGSFEEIRRLAAQHPFVRGFRLSRNFGHQAALTIGLQRSRGDVVCIIDDDLQDPPELLPEFIARLDQAEVVYGIRCRRKESLPRRTLYSLFYRLLRRLSAVDIPLDAGDFCVMKRCVVEAMLQFREVNPFLRGSVRG